MPLKPQEIEQFKKILEDMHRKLSQSLENASEQVKQPDDATGYTQHQADQGTDDFDRTINIEVTGKEMVILRQIERALTKIDENTYGICDISGVEIPKPRLDAIPYASMTVQAQEKIEKGQL